MRALFEHCGVKTLYRLGLEQGMMPAHVRAAYAAAQRNHAARNMKFDAIDD